ncbi:hypothetical protein VD17_14325 [Pseudomonas fluorescens]|uniref:Uncharacterized protein n=1 Tax=Pseudomonas fluorescens TaxID=294 RepID=A0A0F4V8R9_PSEFL|nr:hypothetical protein VD17_14325 [Pseudomonas fluorescens]
MFQVAEFLKKLTVSPLYLWERARVRGRRSIRSKPKDLLKHVTHPLNDLQIAKPHNLNTLLLKVKRSTLVMYFCRRLVMLTTIQFDGQLQFHAIKIQDVRRAWKLPTEFQIGDLPRTEFLPEQELAVSLIGAQMAGELALVGGGAGGHASRPCEGGWRFYCSRGFVVCL